MFQTRHTMRTALLRLALLATALVAPQAFAATYYFADCAADAAPTCVAGSNANIGTSAAAPKQNLTGFQYPQGTGHAFRFARGGSFANAYIDAPAGDAPDSIVFESYLPTWCSGACASRKPILSARIKSNGLGDDLIRFWFKRGVTVRDLELRGIDGAGYGVMVQGSRDILLDNLTIGNFAIAVYTVYGHTGTVTERITLRNSSIVRNKAQGFLGSAKDLLLENNRFEGNGRDNATRDHNIYLSSSSFVVPGVVVRGNTLTRNAGHDGVACNSVALVAHGHLPDLTIENNTIVEEASRGACWGIAVNGVTTSKVEQRFPGLVIRGNTVRLEGDGGVGITCSSCPGAVIENNIVVRSGGSTSFTGVQVPSGAPNLARGDLADDAIVVRNNTLEIATPGRATGLTFAPGSSNDVVVSNLIVFDGATNTALCMHTGARSIQSFRAIDHNLCWRTGGNAFAWSDQAPTLGAAQAAGFDQSSLAVDPGLSTTLGQAGVAMTALDALPPASPAINAGHRTLSSPLDAAGVQRDTLPDIGAIERTARPSAPSNLVVQ